MPPKWDNPTPEMLREFQAAAAHVPPGTPAHRFVTIQRQIASANLMWIRRNAPLRAAIAEREAAEAAARDERAAQDAANEERIRADIAEQEQMRLEAVYVSQRVSGPSFPNQPPQVWEPILQTYRPLRPGEPYPEHQYLNTPDVGQDYATTTQTQVDYASVEMRPEDQAALINFVRGPRNSSGSRSGSSEERRSNKHDKANRKPRHH